MLSRARLGRIEYLNVLPIYFGLENLFGENGFQLVRGTPAELNAAMRRGEVDLGSISALEYGRHPGSYLLLQDLSISSRGPVGSVLLFSRVPFGELQGQSIRVSAASASGAALLKVLLAELFRVTAHFHRGPLAGCSVEAAAAALAIGDEALRLKHEGAWPFELDLGAAWQELSGLPFVFGVWAVRRDFAQARPEETLALHRLLLHSKSWGLGSLPALSRLAAASFGMTPEAVLAYFQQLDYALGPDHQRGLRTFFHYLYAQGELPEEPRLEYFQG